MVTQGTFTIIDISDGAQWYSGTAITGTSTEPTVFSNSGIDFAVEGDMYLNTNTQNTYRCERSGDAFTATWVYVNNIKGENGVGISYIVTQYCLSNNNTLPHDGNWVNIIPPYVKGKYYWVRQYITWENGNHSYSPNENGALDNALTDANKRSSDALDKANEAIKTSTKYIAKIDDNGIRVQSYNDTTDTPNTDNYLQLTSDGLDIYKDGLSVANYGETVRIGTIDGSKIEIEDDSMSMLVDGTPLIQMRINDEKFEISKRTDYDWHYINNNENSFSFTFDIEQYPDVVNSITIGVGIILETAGHDQYNFKQLFAYGTASSKEINDGSYSCIISYDGLYSFTIANLETVFGELEEITIWGIYRLRKYSASIILGSTNQTIYKPFSVTEGYDCQAIESYAHAEGESTEASGGASHAEGGNTKASGGHSHAEGWITTASGGNSHAEGDHTTASGSFSHAEGESTEASGRASHAEGNGTMASGNNSHASGYATIANGKNQTVIGRCNVPDYTSLFIIGKGDSSNSRSNALTVSTEGNLSIAGTANIGGNTTISGNTSITGTLNTTDTITQNGTAVSLNGHKHSASDITSGTLPIERGGSGSSGTTSTTTISDICTAASGWSVTQAQYCSWGKVATIHIDCKKNSTAASSGYQTICTLKEGKRPKLTSPALKGWHDGAIVQTDGEIKFSDSVAANESVQIRATYVLA